MTNLLKTVQRLSQRAPGCSRRCQARTKSAISCATALAPITPRVSTVLQQILQHVGVADAIAVSDAADAGRRQIAVC